MTFSSGGRWLKTQLIPILRPCSLGLSLTEVSLAHISVKLEKTLPGLPSKSVLCFVQGLIHSAPGRQALQLHIIVWPGRMCSAMHLEHCTDLNFSALKTDFLVI